MCVCVCVTIDFFKKKEALNVKESREGYMGGLRGRKGKRELLQSKHNLKNKQQEDSLAFTLPHWLKRSLLLPTAEDAVE